MPRDGVEMEIVALSSLNRVAAFDPALSKRTTAARSAVVVHGVDPIGRIFQLDVMARRDDPLQIIDDVFRLIFKYQVRRCAIEDVLFQKVLIDLLQERCKFWNRDNPKNPIYPGVFEGVKPPKGVNKDGRIRALIGSCFEEGRVYIHASQTEFIDEYLHFPIGATKDILDAFAYASQLWTPGEAEDDVEEYLEREERFLAQRDPITGY